MSCREIVMLQLIDRQDAKFHRFTWLSSLIGFCNHFLGLAFNVYVSFPSRKGRHSGIMLHYDDILHARKFLLGKAQKSKFLAVICFVDELSACVKKNCNDRHHHLIICEGQRWWTFANGWCDGASSPQIPLEISYQRLGIFRVSLIIRMGCNDRRVMKYHWYHFIFYFILILLSSSSDTLFLIIVLTPALCWV